MSKRTPAVNPVEWTRGQPCMGATELFFPPQREFPKARSIRVAKAKAACMDCVAIEPCRDYAHAYPVDGIWGGESEEDRLIADPVVPLTYIGARALARNKDPAIQINLEIRRSILNPDNPAS